MKQFEEPAAAISKKAVIDRFKCVYRSGKEEGRLAPDVKEAMKTLHTAGAQGIVTYELLSISADVESFTEINVECQEVAAALNADFAVSKFPGDCFDTVMTICTHPY